MTPAHILSRALVLGPVSIVRHRLEPPGMDVLYRVEITVATEEGDVAVAADSGIDTAFAFTRACQNLAKQIAGRNVGDEQ